MVSAGRSVRLVMETRVGWHGPAEEDLCTFSTVDRRLRPVGGWRSARAEFNQTVCRLEWGSVETTRSDRTETASLVRTGTGAATSRRSRSGRCRDVLAMLAQFVVTVVPHTHDIHRRCAIAAREKGGRGLLPHVARNSSPRQSNLTSRAATHSGSTPAFTRSHCESSGSDRL